MGYLGAPVAEEYGGRSLDYISYGLIVEEIGRGDSSARTVVSVQTSLVAGSIEQWGTEEQKREILPKLCSGEWLGCFGLTEPGTGLGRGLGRDPRDASKNGGWSISGSKMFISLGNNAKVAMIFAQTDPEKKHRGVACFLVPTDRPGLHLAGDPRQARAARIRHRGAGARRRRGVRRRDAGRGRRRLQDRDVGARPRPLQRRGRLRRDLPGLRQRVGQVLEGAPASSTGRSRASSSCRS